VIAFVIAVGAIAEAARASLRITQRMPLMASDMKEEQPRMLSKLTLALATTAVIGAAALTPSTADAHWRGYGWYGGYGYAHSWQQPHYGYGYGHGHYGYRPYAFYPRHHRWHHGYGWNRSRGYY
jgi:hypothetical protein